jgi:rhomboid family GlyGly-CTERM serine protease
LYESAARAQIALRPPGTAIGHGVTAFRQQLSRPARMHRKWLACLGISFCAVLLTAWPDGLRHFRYDRAALQSGEVWRLVTGHLVHLDSRHLLFNLAGLFLLCELLWQDMPLSRGLALLGVTMLGVSGLLLWLHPELAWYAGLSGALHGLWSGSALMGCRPPAVRPNIFSATPTSAWRRVQKSWPLVRCVSLIGLVLLIGKLALESRHGALLYSDNVTGTMVITAAHLYGALIGSGAVLIWFGARCWRR